jgi:hypothetical protein
MRPTPALLISLVPAALIGFCILLTGFATEPPRYETRAAFTIDWKKMPDVSNDGQISKLKKAWRETLKTYLSQTEDDSGAKQVVMEINAPGIGDIFNDSIFGKKFVLPLTNAAVATDAIKNNLQVNVSEVSKDTDKVVVQMKDNNTNEAVTVVDYVMKQQLSNVTLQNVVGRVLVEANNPDSQKLEDEMSSIRDGRQKLADKIASGDYDTSDLDKKRELDQQLSGLSDKEDLNKLEALGRFLDSPISTVEPTHVIDNGAAFRRSVICFALFAAAFGAFLGLSINHLIFSKRTRKKAAIPPILKPPIIG